MEAPLKRSFAHATLVCSVLALAATPSVIQGQSVGYSVVPSYEQIRWGDAFGLEDNRLFGARLALDFGPYFSLQPFYEWQNNVGIRSDLTIPSGADVATAFDVALFGAAMQVNFGSGSLVPFIKGGGGILRTDDEINGKIDRIFLRGGGGVRFGLGDRTGGEIFAERISNRLDKPFIPGAVEQAQLDKDNNLVNSLLFGAGFRIALGGASPGGDGMSGILPGIFLEPFSSRIDFDSKMHLGRQYTVGARGGIDFNQNVGLRAYYWRAVDDKYKDWTDMEGFGAEAQFALNTGPGLSPFLVTGVGRITPFGEYRDEDGNRRDKFDHFTLGAGVSWALGDRSNLEFAARDLLTTVGSDIQDVANFNDLISNWQYSAGLSISFGAKPNLGRDREQRDMERRGQAMDAEARELARLREENRRLRNGEPVDSMRSVRDTVVKPRQAIMVPVPEVGEIILRYGKEYSPAGGMPMDTSAAGRASNQAMMASLRALSDSIRRDQDERNQAILDQIRASQGTSRAPVVTPAAEGEPNPGFVDRLQLGAWMPYLGLEAVKNDPNRFLLGLQADLGQFSETVPLEFIADISFGLGGGSSTFMISANARYSFDLGTTYDIRPFVEGGLGISDRRLLNVNLGYGSAFTLHVNDKAVPLFVEHRGIQLFKDSQFMIGLRIPR